MADGFLGYPSTLMLDVVVCALVLVVPLLLYSIYLVKTRQKYVLHRNLQVSLGTVLMITVLLFEIDMRMHGGWRNILARRSEPLTPDALAIVTGILYVHLFFAVTTVILWGMTLFLAWRHFSRPPLPGRHSRLHKRLGWLSSIDIALTSLTGLMFYYFAFVRL